MPGEIRLIVDPEPAIQWDWGDNHAAASFGSRAEDRLLLENFIELADAPDDQFLIFAKRYGPLYLCQHNKPVSHLGRIRHVSWASPVVSLKVLEESVPDLYHQLPCTLSKREPLVAWRYWSQHVRTILRLATRIRSGVPGDERDWVAYFEDLNEDRDLESNDDKDAVERAREHRNQPLLTQWSSVTFAINSLIIDADVRPKLSFYSSIETEIVVEGCGVLGAVARELAYVATEGCNFTICDACGATFVPRTRDGRLKKRRAGESHYCDEEECKRVGHSERQNRYRRRRQQDQPAGVHADAAPRVDPVLDDARRTGSFLRSLFRPRRTPDTEVATKRE